MVGTRLNRSSERFLPVSAERKKKKTASAENGDGGTREQTEQAAVPPVIQIYPMFGLRNKYSAQNTL